MLKYKAEGGVVTWEVLDFPGVISYGDSLESARAALSGALLDLADTWLLEGRALPPPTPHLTRSDADVEEPIILSLEVFAGQRRS